MLEYGRLFICIIFECLYDSQSEKKGKILVKCVMSSTATNVKIEILDKKPMRLEMAVSGLSLPELNGLRRIIQSDIRTVSAHIVKIHENTSVIQDEMFAHRLSQLPVRVADDDLDPVEGARITIFGDFVCENGTPSNPMVIFSEDLTVSGSGMIPWSNILIAKLIKGQRLHFEAICKVGTEREHAKWSPVCDVTYAKLPDTDAYRFCVETIGSRSPEDVFLEAIAVLRRKCVSCTGS